MDLMSCLEGRAPLGVPVTTNHEIRQEVWPLPLMPVCSVVICFDGLEQAFKGRAWQFAPEAQCCVPGGKVSGITLTGHDQEGCRSGGRHCRQAACHVPQLRHPAAQAQSVVSPEGALHHLVHCQTISATACCCVGATMLITLQLSTTGLSPSRTNLTCDKQFEDFSSEASLL
jgi:hypothetical protein